MIFACQKSAITELDRLADQDRHSLLIEGPAGCGKSYLARYYANKLGIPDFQNIQPTVSSIRESLDMCLSLENKIVLNIENLDVGVDSASYSILKFLEEPTTNVYVVVTCRNIKDIPETIISRCVCVTNSPPTPEDILCYTKEKHGTVYDMLRSTGMMEVCHTFADIDKLSDMNLDKINYIKNVFTLLKNNKRIPSIVWEISHFPDNSETPLDIVLGYMIHTSANRSVIKYCVDCMTDLYKSRIGKQAILSKFVLDMKYGG